MNTSNVSYKVIKDCIGFILVFVVLSLVQTTLCEEKSLPTIKEMLESTDPNVQMKTVYQILDDRLKQVNMLIDIVDHASDGKVLEKSGDAAAFLLGKMRAPEAVPVLSTALAKVKPYITTDIDPLMGAVFNALVEIGRPSIPAMIKNITTSDNEILRERSMDVVYHVLGGKENIIGLLNRLMEQKERTKVEKDRIKKSLEWAQSHYKETEKPLY